MAKDKHPKVRVSLPPFDIVQKEEKWGRDEILSLMKNHLKVELDKYYREVFDLETWNKIIIAVQGSFRSFVYRGFITDYDVMLINRQRDIIVECRSNFFEMGFFYLHIRDYKVKTIFNIFDFPSEEWGER